MELKWKYFPLKISFYFVCKTICVHTYISVLCRLLGKEPLKKNDWSSFTWVHVGAICTHLYCIPHTWHHTVLVLYLTVQLYQNRNTWQCFGRSLAPSGAKVRWCYPACGRVHSCGFTTHCSPINGPAHNWTTSWRFTATCPARAYFHSFQKPVAFVLLRNHFVIT